MKDHVTRYVVTHVNQDGMREMCGPGQGRHTYATAEEAQAQLDAMMGANRIEKNGMLAGVFGLPLKVLPTPCYPGHFDPTRTLFGLEDKE